MSTSLERRRGAGVEASRADGGRWVLWPALVAALVSGVAVFVNGVAVRHFDDATVYTTAKNLWAGVLLAAVLVALPARAASRPVDAGADRPAWPWLVVVAVVGGAVPFVLFFEGLALATSTDAAFIHKTLVVWVAVGASVVLHERLRPVHLVAIGLLVIGHVVVSGGISLAGVGRGEALILAATLLWTLEVLLVKRLLVTAPAPYLATVRMLGGSVVLLGWLAVRGDLGALAAFTTGQWWWIALTGTTLAGFVSLWYRALAAAPATDVTAVLVAGAVVTAILNTGFRGVPVTVDAVGYLAVLAGVVLVAVSSARSEEARPSHGLVS
ncbi:MAG TPA: DMT family transporter [Ilumatobacteraceae bacterium]|nr:DMT family transporter [Ilumatobacteraceae bacterium]